jgi:peptidoglycan/xylan/chitin deacetylase (PgdA/CDA1 family)
MPSKGFVLAFHSQNVSGNTYETNDHVALDLSLALIASSAIPVLPALEVVDAMRDGEFERLPPRFVCLTFDDGPDYDWRVVRHPEWGPQEPMVAILERHSPRLLGIFHRKKTTATSFVIASPEARAEIAGPEHPSYLSEDWWRTAQDSGFLYVGNHGWNHVHPAVSEMKQCPELVENFAGITSLDQAELQVRRAGEYIRAEAGPDAGKLFAYPYGQVSAFLADEYLPRQEYIQAAFTTEGVPLTADANLWRLPRYVCGWHWKSVEGLARILGN